MLGWMPFAPVAAQDFEIVYSLPGMTHDTLTLINGRLHGTTASGGDHGQGTVFSAALDGSDLQVLHSFDGSGGTSSHAAVVHAGSRLYGTMRLGGAHGNGTIYSLADDGSDFQLLHSFDVTDGVLPESRVTIAGNRLYGTTYLEGTEQAGTIYSMNLDGTDFQVLRSFDGYDAIRVTDGLLYADGRLYGTSPYGGASLNVPSLGYGSIFSIAPDGSDFQVLHSFENTDGAFPDGPLIFANGTLFGTTGFGGSEEAGTVFALNLYGTGFHLVHEFDSVPNLEIGDIWPRGQIAYVDGMIYGTTLQGETASGSGTIYAVDVASGEIQFLHTFTGGAGGSGPQGLMEVDGVLYGVTDDEIFRYVLPVPEPATWVLACLGAAIWIAGRGRARHGVR